MNHLHLTPDPGKGPEPPHNFWTTAHRIISGGTGGYKRLRNFLGLLFILVLAGGYYYPKVVVAMVRTFIDRMERDYMQPKPAEKTLCDSLQTVQPPQPVPAPEPVAAPPISRRSHQPRRRAAPPVPHVAPPVTPPPPTPQQVRHQQGEQEGQSWRQFLDASDLSDHRRHRVGIGRNRIISGYIKSSASVATYQDLTLRVVYYPRKRGVPQQENIVLRISVPPGGSTFVEQPLRRPRHTDNIRYELIGAQYMLQE